MATSLLKSYISSLNNIITKSCIIFASTRAIIIFLIFFLIVTNAYFFTSHNKCENVKSSICPNFYPFILTRTRESSMYVQFSSPTALPMRRHDTTLVLRADLWYLLGAKSSVVRPGHAEEYRECTEIHDLADHIISQRKPFPLSITTKKLKNYTFHDIYCIHTKLYILKTYRHTAFHFISF